MMREPRSVKLKRLVTVQRQLERLAETDLAETNRERDRISAAIDGVVGAMNSLAPTHRVFSHLYAQRVGTLSLRNQRLDGLASVQEQKLLIERAKADRLQETMKEARTAEEREAEDASLYDLIDQIGANGRSSLP